MEADGTDDAVGIDEAGRVAGDALPAAAEVQVPAIRIAGADVRSAVWGGVAPIGVAVASSGVAARIRTDVGPGASIDRAVGGTQVWPTGVGADGHTVAGVHGDPPAARHGSAGSAPAGCQSQDQNNQGLRESFRARPHSLKILFLGRPARQPAHVLRKVR